jgi:hypothetical protein
MAYENAIPSGSYDLPEGDVTRKYAQSKTDRRIIRFTMNWYDQNKVMEPVVTFEDYSSVSGRIKATDNLWAFIDTLLVPAA